MRLYSKFILTVFLFSFIPLSNGQIIYTIAGNGIKGFSGDSGVAINASILMPYGVAVDTKNNVYFADAGNCRIRRISTSGIITTVAGNGTAGSNGDGGPATLA